MKFKSSILDNGLAVVSEGTDSAQSSSLGFFVRTGARDESPELSGVSHFLEHMMFKGTQKRSALDVTYELGAIGAQANAYTSEETTVYYAYVLPEYFRDVFEILSDMLRPALDQQEFDTEKNVILEEIALYKDRPTHVLFEAAIREHFINHGAGNSVLGTTESVGALSRRQMKQYFDERYVPSNMVLVASGKVDFSELVDLANEHCSKWVDAECKRTLVPNIPVESERVITKKNLQCAHLCYIAQGPSATQECSYAASVLSCMLGDSTGSRTYWDLVDKGLADSAMMDVDTMDGTGTVYGYASGAPDKIDTIGEIFANIMTSPLEFNDDDLERAKTKLGTRLVISGESSRRRLMSVGNDWIYRNEYFTLQQELDKIKSVSKGDIETLLESYSFSPVTKVKLIPQE